MEIIDNLNKDICVTTHFIEHLRSVLPIAKQFDGKVLNVRFTKKICEELGVNHVTIENKGHLFCDSYTKPDYNKIWFEYAFINTKIEGYSRNRRFMLFPVQTDKNGNPRFDYDLFLTYVNQRIDSLNEQIAEAQFGIDNFEELTRTANALNRQCNDLVSKIKNYELYSYFKDKLKNIF